VERFEAEAIYDAGRETCVQLILDLAARGRELRPDDQVDEIVDH